VLHYVREKIGAVGFEKFEHWARPKKIKSLEQSPFELALKGQSNLAQGSALGNKKEMYDEP